MFVNMFRFCLLLNVAALHFSSAQSNETTTTSTIVAQELVTNDILGVEADEVIAVPGGTDEENNSNTPLKNETEQLDAEVVVQGDGDAETEELNADVVMEGNGEDEKEDLNADVVMEGSGEDEKEELNADVVMEGDGDDVAVAPGTDNESQDPLTISENKAEELNADVVMQGDGDDVLTQEGTKNESQDPLMESENEAKEPTTNNVVVTDSAADDESEEAPIAFDLNRDDLYTDVVVGGAGYAGISATKFLAQNSDTKFCIVEATERIGGRMYAVPFGTDSDTGGSYVIESGAHWIDGLGGNPVWDQAKKTGLKGAIQKFDATMYDRKGKRNDEETTFERGSVCRKAEAAFEGSKELSEKCLRLSSGTALRRKRQALCNKIREGFIPEDEEDMSLADLMKVVNGFNPATEVDPAMARACEVFLVDFDTGLEGSLSSAHNTHPNMAYKTFKEGDFLVDDPRGYAWVVKSEASEYLSTSVKNESQIVFNDPRMKFYTKVVQVDWDPSGDKNVMVTVCHTKKKSLPNSPNLYPCIKNKESTYTITANEFISTFSLEVIKKSIQEEEDGVPLEKSINVAPRFVPPLSEAIPEYVAAIKKEMLGNYCKVFFQFPIKFWPDTEYIVSAYSDGVYVGDFAPMWMSLDNGSTEDYHPGSKILVAFLTGQRAIEAGKKTDQELMDELLPVLNTMFVASLKRRLRRRLRSSDVLDFYVTRWPQDPLYRGGFTADALGVSSETQSMLGNRYGNLVFSGEHTCQNYYGYTVGAKMAGERSARRLLNERYGKEEIDTFSMCDEQEQ